MKHEDLFFGQFLYIRNFFLSPLKRVFSLIKSIRLSACLNAQYAMSSNYVACNISIREYILVTRQQAILIRKYRKNILVLGGVIYATFLGLYTFRFL